MGRGRRESSVPDALGGNEGVGKLLHDGGFASHQNHFQAVIVVQMYVH